jgi:hypothetical protein
MYDAGKIIPGLVIFGVLLTSPIWYSAASGKIHQVPEPQVPAGETQCVESADYMRDNHMHLLEQWRQMVVRDGVHTYVASDGKEYDISLIDTCMKCHPNKEEFCDQCHDYLGIKPNCWDCHNAPEGDQ